MTSAPGGAAIGSSPRTVVAAVRIERDHAQLLFYTIKERPFAGLGLAAARPWAAGESLQAEIVLFGPESRRYTQRLDLGPLCLEHDGDAEPHIAGDTIELHRDTFLVELPEIAGYSQLEVAVHHGEAGYPERVALAVDVLDAARFTPAGEGGSYADLAFADPAAAASLGPPVANTTGSVSWPEDYGDPQRYRVYGNEAEKDRRINVVIVPDGYTYAEKAAMEAHAETLVASFRSRTPYKEHDPFLNYTLVYAYSTESGTDECDCDRVKDTAMNTRFPDAGADCGNFANRCLYYGTANGGPACDPTTTDVNIAAAELRAPIKDTTVVMVNTARYGGCGGLRAVYAAANVNAGEIALHELGHTLAGLADEYGGYTSCGGGVGINVSTDPAVGNWPEWIAELGAPRESAKYYNSCVFRPATACAMRTLGDSFCPVCTQRFALSFFGHARVQATAPVAGQLPDPAVVAQTGTPVTFTTLTRLGVGTLNRFTWQLQGPGDAAPITVASGSPVHTATFAATGVYTLTCEVVADTNFVKPEKNGANRDVATWTVTVIEGAGCDPAPVFAGIREASDLEQCARSGIELGWDAAVFGDSGGAYDVFRDGARVASGVAASPYLDSPGDGASHSYMVAAVSADCGIGDGNAVALAASDQAAEPVSARCGNNVCEAGDGEDCLSCPADCAGKLDGKPSARFCCGDGGGQYPVSCGDPRCSGNGRTCRSTPVPPTSACCGNGMCEAGETCATCPADCAPAAEVCSGGGDEDCDGLTDCQDGDCSSELACKPSSCGAVGTGCRSGSECCSGNCDKRRGVCR